MKITSINVCLGIKNKIETLRQSNEIIESDIVIVQDAEINKDDSEFSTSLKNFKQYRSRNEPKSRLCVYVKQNLKHSIKYSENIELMKVEVGEMQIFGLYRPFKIANNQTYAGYLTEIVDWIKQNSVIGKPMVIIGDLNLDYNHRSNPNYSNHKLLQEWLQFTDSLSLKQTVKENTWARVINGTVGPCVH